jgi:predicted PurR-regulated permease PerM
MPLDNNSLNRFRVNVSSDDASKWARRRDIPIAILAWIALGVTILWAASHFTRSLLVLTVAALLAFALMPAVRLLERVMPRFLAIIIVYLVVLSGLSLLIYFIVNTTITQIISFAQNISLLQTPGKNSFFTPLLHTLQQFGISQSQLNGIAQQIIGQAQGIVGGAVPLLTSIFDFFLDFIIVAVLSIYLLVDGPRVKHWIWRNMPLVQRERARFIIHAFERVIGGYIRGQLLLSSLIGLLVGGGMTLFGVPYPVLLGVMAFVLEFVPVLGTITSGAICVLLALTRGWLIALLVLAYFVGVHILEGDVVGPRIVGKAVGLHPAISLVALIAGGELFGIWGVILASPIAGLVQAVLSAIWQEWRQTHPDQFPTDEPDSTAEDFASDAEDIATPVEKKT